MAVKPSGIRGGAAQPRRDAVTAAAPQDLWTALRRAWLGAGLPMAAESAPATGTARAAEPLGSLPPALPAWPGWVAAGPGR